MPPAPEAPKTLMLTEVESQSGNSQLEVLFNRQDELINLAKTWSQTAEKISKRSPIWARLQSLLKHAKPLGPYADIKAEVDAIESQRGLLAEPDPVRPLLDKAVELLRQALQAKLAVFKQVLEQQWQHLQEDADWQKLSEDQRVDLTAKHHLSIQVDVAYGTPEQLQDSLDDCDLEHWVSKAQALPSRFEAARMAAVQLLKPNVISVKLPRRTLTNETELQAWLDEVHALVLLKLKDGPVAL